MIVAVDGKPVRRLSDLTDELDQIGVGNTAKLAVMRNGSKVTIDVPIGDVGQQ